MFRARLFASIIALPMILVAQTRTFVDGDFEGWSTPIGVLDTDPPGTWAFSLRSDGGNPGVYRRITHTYHLGTYAAAHKYRRTAHNPAIHGPIQSVDYSWDLNGLGSNLAGVTHRLMVYQAGAYYFGSILDHAGSETRWQRYAHPGLRASDFVRRSGAGPSNPDFSSRGGVLIFGYETSVTGISRNAATRQSGLDNFSLTIHIDTASTNRPPVAIDDQITMLAGETRIVQVLANDTDPDQNLNSTSIALVNVTQPGLIEVRPDATGRAFEVRSRAAGTASFTYTVSDTLAVRSNEARVLVTATPLASCRIEPQHTYLGPGEDRSRQTVTAFLSDETGQPLRQFPMARVVTERRFMERPRGGFWQSSTDVFETEPFERETVVSDDNGQIQTSFELRADEAVLTLRGSRGGLTFECLATILNVPRDFSWCWLKALLRSSNLGPHLPALRRFRERVLRHDAELQHFIDDHYRLSPEVLRILARNPTLGIEAVSALRRFQPRIDAASEGRVTSFKPEELRYLDTVLARVASEGSTDLRNVIEQVREAMQNPDLLARMGVTMSVSSREGGASSSPPVRFEQNRGQLLGEYAFVAQAGLYRTYLRGDEALVAPRVAPLNSHAHIRMKLVGGDPGSASVGENPTAGRTHYLIGRDPRRWTVGIPNYEAVRFADVYPGIDLVYREEGKRLEYDFIVRPGAPPSDIRLTFPGATSEVLPNGALVVAHKGVEIGFRRPVAFQNIDGRQTPVDSAFRLAVNGEVTFDVGRYDTSSELVIDPLLDYFSYVGDAQEDMTTSAATGPDNSLYLTGITNRADTGAAASVDGVVIKLNSAGDIVYSTYFGGADEDMPLGIAVDDSGSAYVVGATTSRDLPAINAGQATFGGAGAMFGTDAFVIKLSPDGARPLFSTYLGGQGDEGARGIALDGLGGLYVGGGTSSANFPVRNPVQATFRGGDAFASDGFIALLDASTGALEASTFLGGQHDDAVTGIAVDVGGFAYVTGITKSTDFPVAGGAWQPTLAGRTDAFVVRVEPLLERVSSGTYLGGPEDDFALGIALGPQSHPHVVGFTSSGEGFPQISSSTLVGAERKFDTSDAYIVKFTPDVQGATYAMLLGGADADQAVAVAVDSQGRASVAGTTFSSDFPVARASQPAAGGAGDAFVTTLGEGGAILASTYLGGSASDAAYGVALDSTGRTIMVGMTYSTDAFIPGARVQAQPAGGPNGWIARTGLLSQGGVQVASVSAASFFGPAHAPDSIASAFGEAFATQTELAAQIPLPTRLAGASLEIMDSGGRRLPAGLISVHPNQINYVLPPGLALGPATISVSTSDARVLTGNLQIAHAVPGIFTAKSNGRGTAAAFALRVMVDGKREQTLIFDGQTRGATPISLGADSDQVFLILFGTGMRAYRDTVEAYVDGERVPVVGPVPQGEYAGLDQVNVGPLPRSLAGRGNVEVLVVVDGKAANSVTAEIQ